MAHWGFLNKYGPSSICSGFGRTRFCIISDYGKHQSVELDVRYQVESSQGARHAIACNDGAAITQLWRHECRLDLPC
eukprot:5048592-Amphidinium_carterae.1